MATIIWDEPKRQSNLALHGLDFADLDEWFFPGCRDGFRQEKIVTWQ